jgi:phosphoserine phosphatase
MTSLNSKQSQFIGGVLALGPRVAAFDCDGTLWTGDAGEGFFSWELQRGLVSAEIVGWARARYADYRAGKVAEDVMCGEMATMHHGLREETVQSAADEYFAAEMEQNVFPEMRELVRRLVKAGCEVWAVSSSNQWVIRAGMRSFGIPADRILSAEAVVENGVISEDLLRVPSGPGKAEAIRTVVKKAPDCAFGNAIWDREMLALARHPFVINPTAALQEIGAARGWPIYQPEVNHLERRA